METKQVSLESGIMDITFIVNRYTTLVDHVDTRVFPSADNPPFIEVNDTSRWPKWLSFLYRFTMPFPMFSMSNPSLTPMAVTVFWMLMFAGWAAWSTFLFETLFGSPENTSEIPALPWYAYINIAIYILSALLGTSAYIQAFAFLINRKNSWKIRFLWLATFILIFVYLMIWLQQTYPGTFPSALENPGMRTNFTVTVIFFTLPSVIFSALIVSVVIRSVPWMLKFIFDYFLAGNNPNTYLNVSKVIIEPVGQGEKQWMMLDLSSKELRTIREWARDNLDATDKRLVPTFWILTLLGLFMNTIIFENWLKNLVRYISSQYEIFQDRGSMFAVPLDVFLIFVVFVPVILGLITLVTGIYIAMFRNIAVQSMLIDSCTVSLYHLEKKEEWTSVNPIQQERGKMGFWRCLFG